MKEPFYRIELSAQKHLELLTTISAGLLASGHFTMEADDDTTDGSEQLMQAKDPRRGCALLVTDAAVEILSD
jgi:hypothetical protein